MTLRSRKSPPILLINDSGGSSSCGGKKEVLLSSSSSSTTTTAVTNKNTTTITTSNVTSPTINDSLLQEQQQQQQRQQQEQQQHQSIPSSSSSSSHYYVKKYTPKLLYNKIIILRNRFITQQQQIMILITKIIKTGSSSSSSIRLSKFMIVLCLFLTLILCCFTIRFVSYQQNHLRISGSYDATTTTTTTFNNNNNCIQATEEQLKAPIWEWHYFSSSSSSANDDDTSSSSSTNENNNNNNPTLSSSSSSSSSIVFEQQAREKLLIAQYSGHNELLMVTSKINRAYAQKWKHDYVVVQGTTMINQQQQQQENDNNNNNTATTKTTSTLPICQSFVSECTKYNIITLLQMALTKRHKYDQILILDNTALLHDFQYDITTLLPSQKHQEKERHMVLTAPIRKKSSSSASSTSFFSTTPKSQPPHEDSIDYGITLWNLNHPSITSVIQDWDVLIRTNILSISSSWLSLSLSPTKSYLYDVLYNYDTSLSHIYELTRFNEFTYPHGTLIQRFYTESNYYDRTKDDWLRIDNSISDICGFTMSYQKDSNYDRNNSNIPLSSSSSSSSSSWMSVCDNLCTSKVPRRAPQWEWKYYSSSKTRPATTTKAKTITTSKSNNNTISKKNNNDNNNNKYKNRKDKRRVLIAQYSAFGSYAKLLELTSPINKAYARYYQHDYVVLQGSALSIFPRDIWCTPPEERSRFNKIILLQMALAKKDQYDILLLLDADAMIYDFSKDIRSFVPTKTPPPPTTTTPMSSSSHNINNDNNNNDNNNNNSMNDIMLVAHRVNEQTDYPYTWDINNGVTIWNLHHPLTAEIVDDWYTKTIQSLKRNPYTRSYMLTGDQALLHGTLRDNDRWKNIVYTYRYEFQYRNATVIKHFIRENLNWNKDNVWQRTSLDTRSDNIQNASNTICTTYFPVCEGIEHIMYTKT